MNQLKSIAKSIYEDWKNDNNLKNHLEYRLLWNKYYEFKRQVITKQKTFDIFILDSINYLSIITYSLDSNQQTIREKHECYSKVRSIFQLRSDLIFKYFSQTTFNLQSAKNLLGEFDSTTIITTEQNLSVFNQKIEINDIAITKVDINNVVSIVNEDSGLIDETNSIKKQPQEIIDLCIDKAKHYYLYKNKTSHMGTRIGGYLFVSKRLNENELETREQIWERLTGFKIGDTIYLYSPYTVKTKYKSTTINHLKELYDFFIDIDEDISKIIDKDINRLKNK